MKTYELNYEVIERHVVWFDVNDDQDYATELKKIQDEQYQDQAIARKTIHRFLEPVLIYEVEEDKDE